MPTSPGPGERYILGTEEIGGYRGSDAPIQIAASAAEDRDGEAADPIEECKWRKRAT
jgi:hypothetical protein